MIFVTVGTHEEPFNRLIKEVDTLVLSGMLKEDVFIQRGVCSFIPKICPSVELLSYEDMLEKFKDARIIITHGGPGSIMTALSFGKTPIVAPRKKEYNEHVDNHQVDFVRRLEHEKKVIAVYDIANLGETIKSHEYLLKGVEAHRNSTGELTRLVDNLERYCDDIRRQGGKV